MVVKRSCTEAMLKVREGESGVGRPECRRPLSKLGWGSLEGERAWGSVGVPALEAGGKERGAGGGVESGPLFHGAMSHVF